MKSGDKDDIYIDRYPTEVGFAITNPVIALEEGIFPRGADNHDPLSWGTMTIAGRKHGGQRSRKRVLGSRSMDGAV